MASRDGLNSDLEAFRREWLSDLRSKRDETAEPPQLSPYQSLRRSNERPAASSSKQSHAHPRARGSAQLHEDDDHYVQSLSFDEPSPRPGHALAESSKKAATCGDKELVSALDHYEEAMEKEAQGNMGESLKLYRKAYRLDVGVDKRYREKHFPQAPTAPKAHAAAPKAAHQQPPQTVPENSNTPSEPKPQTIGDLIASFATLKIDPVPPEVEGMPQPPCPIATLPDELLVHILQDVAVDDVGDFGRAALVCKHFAYLVATEERIWRRVCLGGEYGFQAMHYHWQKNIDWTALDEQDEEDADGTLVSMRELAERRKEESIVVTRSLVPAAYPTWRTMFRSRPRIRFNGCYISTVNYVRSGQASTNQATWGGAPIHIVTYYRYLRFFRDGTAISLLTTTEPAEVVHHLTKELLQQHRGSAHAHLPSAVMHLALRGRWRLSSALDHPDATAPKDQEGDLYVETEGVDPKYTYRMYLTLRGAGKTTRNTKFAWRGFYSYNKLTDDVAAFALKNDKPFFFSRVRSYGVRGA
ncbi:hypothetical protein S40288_06496 [Stachybotrys chartarum IBT 40288]|nr:hypothetical protein S40288_06496 [Stachybotrys chartarum IBT 40288]